ncbi:MetQ/NlpA family ABC transporter substrate-binding protein [Nonomuraea salmonea]|uniref:MetQ/NlpA family ABC transporter substrate-binding protein n=1 Tax=Nonomuraea salmonea TaxID=46181 RepID=UPI0031EAAF1D
MKIHRFVGAVALALSLAACGTSQSATNDTAESADTVLKVGVNPVPHAEILNFVKDNLAPAAGLKLEVVEFTDYVQPNVQLEEGKLTANYFQHRPYLDDFNKSKGTNLTFVAGGSTWSRSACTPRRSPTCRRWRAGPPWRCPTTPPTWAARSSCSPTTA